MTHRRLGSLPKRTGVVGGLAVLAALATAATLSSCGCGASSAQQQPEPLPTPPPAPSVPTFDGARSLELIRAQCAFGPRTPGSEAHERMLAWLQDQLEPLASRLIVQKFSAKTPFGGPYDFANVLAMAGPSTAAPLLLAAHWDSRPVADQDPDPANRSKPVPGADDGASGVAILLELARIFHDQPPPRPILLAFLDAEDSGKAGSSMPYMGYCIGARYLAAHWPDGWPKPAEGILLDLVGGDGKPVDRIPMQPGIHRNTVFDLGPEGHSLDANPELVNAIWSLAEQLGHSAFVRQTCGYITDDHVPLIAAGIKMVDIIHVFPIVWHTVDDTPDHCSADSLYQVGDTLVHFIYAEH